MYVGAASQHVLRMSFVPEQEDHNFDRQDHDLLVPPHSARRHLSIILFTPQTLGTWCGLCRSAICSGPMACLAIGHSHINGNNPVTRHRYPFQHCTTTQSPTCSTSNNTFTTNEQASFPPQTTWCCSSLENHTKESSHHNPTTFPQATSTPVERSVLLSHPPHTPELTSCNPAAKRTRLRIAASELL